LHLILVIERSDISEDSLMASLALMGCKDMAVAADNSIAGA